MNDRETPSQDDLGERHQQFMEAIADSGRRIEEAAQPELPPLPPRQLRRVLRSWHEFAGEQAARAEQNERARAWWATQRGERP